jgi:hypothetical protein
MGESFLKEQLKRIKDLTEQISRIRTYRDTYLVDDQPAERSSANDEPAPARRPPSRGSSRRRAG